MDHNSRCSSSYSLLACIKVMRIYEELIIYVHKGILVKVQGCSGFYDLLILIFRLD